MDFKNYEYKSDFAKKNFAAGQVEGEAKGIAEGDIASTRRALFDVLRARGFHVDDASRSRIEACRDVALLRTWVSRAAVADVTRPFLDL